jgi:membrane protein
MITAVLFLIGRIVLWLYLYFAEPGSAFGAAGALLVILLWIYYSSQVLFFGACFSYTVENQEKIK